MFAELAMLASGLGDVAELVALRVAYARIGLSSRPISDPGRRCALRPVWCLRCRPSAIIEAQDSLPLTLADDRPALHSGSRRETTERDDTNFAALSADITK